MRQPSEQNRSPEAFVALLERHGWVELTDEPTAPEERPQHLAFAPPTLLATAAAPSLIDLTGRLLVVVGAFLLALCIPGGIAYLRRELRWRRVERVRDRWRRTR